MTVMKSFLRFSLGVAALFTTFTTTAASANPERPCKGTTELEYIGQVLFVTEPIHELKLDQNSERGELKIESDEGEGFVMKISTQDRKMEIVQDPTFGPIKKSLNCSSPVSQGTCSDYVSRAFSAVKQAQFHLTSDHRTESEKRDALECAEHTLESFRNELSE